jgi:hypothetical protein
MEIIFSGPVVAEVVLVILLPRLPQVILKLEPEEMADKAAVVVARAQEAVVLPQELEEQEA